MPINSNLQRKVPIFCGENSVTASTKFSPRRTSRDPLISKSMEPEPKVSMELKVQTQPMSKMSTRFLINSETSSEERDLMPRASSRTQIDTTTSRFPQNNSNRPSHSLVLRSAMLSLTPLSRSTETMMVTSSTCLS